MFPGGSDGKESACNVGDLGSIPGTGRSPGGGHSYPLQHPLFPAQRMKLQPQLGHTLWVFVLAWPAQPPSH